MPQPQVCTLFHWSTSIDADNTSILKADSNNVLSSSGPGRNSNRIQSKKQFGHNTVLVADIRHMPAGSPGPRSGLPKFPTGQVSRPLKFFPKTQCHLDNGEIDIIEGVNNGRDWASIINMMVPCALYQTLAPQLRMTAIGPSIATLVAVSQQIRETLMDQVSIKLVVDAWFWSRSEGNIPADVTTSGQTVINTDNWGTPMALFPNTQCDLSSKFGLNNQFIDNCGLGGDWAGGVYSNSGCPGSCVDFVNNNPSAFTEAYWDIAAIRMYGQ
ncbi:16890_t:CDS:2 [Acaulospora colombiana]|uniref:16890_t:CDS:1 n=1 Tax=Acaulospora colombiana TaxID=27376 RepID=A0ACA9MY99_9GLOM|nr:16890_t:CDS:2 [Acaulospora colombiana]